MVFEVMHAQHAPLKRASSARTVATGTSLAGQRIAAQEALAQAPRLNEFAAILGAHIETDLRKVAQRTAWSAKRTGGDKSGLDGARTLPPALSTDGALDDMAEDGTGAKGNVSPRSQAQHDGSERRADAGEEAGGARKKWVRLESVVSTFNVIYAAEYMGMKARLAEAGLHEGGPDGGPLTAAKLALAGIALPAQALAQLNEREPDFKRPFVLGTPHHTDPTSGFRPHGQPVLHLGGAPEVHSRTLALIADKLRAQTRALRSLSHAEMAAVLAGGTIERHSRYTALYTQGNLAQCLYLLLDGEVTLQHVDGSTSRARTPTYGAGAAGPHLFGLVRACSRGLRAGAPRS
jgi:hypothetical protein